MVKNVRRRMSVLSHLVEIGIIERKAKVEALKEKWGDGEITRRGGRSVVINDSISIDTSILYSPFSITLGLERYEEQWHSSYNYTGDSGSTSYGFGGGYRTTKEVLDHLRQTKERLIPERKKELEVVSRNLGKIIKKLENEIQQ